MKAVLWLKAVLWSLVLATPVYALQLRDYVAASHDRFLNFPSNPSANPGFIFGHLDLTGIGWSPSDTRKQFALVSPIHFVGAKHFWPGTNQSVRFLDAVGTIHTIPILSRETIPNDQGDPSDLFLGTLDYRVPDGVPIAPLAYLNLSSANNYQAYDGLELMTFGMSARAGRGVLDDVVDENVEDEQGEVVINETKMLTFRYRDPDLVGEDDDAHAEAGDSGSPTLTEYNGEPVLLGTHTAVAETDLGLATLYTTYDAFVPHYVDELNARMAGEGYHMRQANPASTTLSLVVAEPVLLRAGYEAVLDFTVTNSGGSDANNLRLEVDAGELAGGAWVDNGAGSLRKAGLTAAESADGQWTVTPGSPGVWQASFSVEADEVPSFSQVEAFTVLPSFVEWASGLKNLSHNGDDDGDGIGNLLEYALGGDAGASSSFVDGTTVSLLPVVEVTGSGVEISHPVRIDAADRALSYEVECSADLGLNSWTSLAGMATSVSEDPLNAEFNLRVASYEMGATRQFFRLKVILAE